MRSASPFMLHDLPIHTQKIADPGNILRNSGLYYSQDFRHERALSAAEKRDGVLASQATLGRFRRDPVGYLNRLITIRVQSKDET
jgi:hypothetical protein